jgi:flagellar protein FliT
VSTTETPDSQAVPVRDEVLRCYGELASTMSLMAALARTKEWERLPELEARCAAVVDRLKAIGTVSLDAAQLERVRSLIRPGRGVRAGQAAAREPDGQDGPVAKAQ